jgi:mannose-6-phosphate isomerase-like protein (cupin superfamily)
MPTNLFTHMMLTASLLGLVAPRAGAQTSSKGAATYVTVADISAFIEALPKDAISDRPIRVVDAGGYRVGVYGVFRPKSMPQEVSLHETSTSEVYYVLEGAGTLTTGGTLVGERRTPGSTTVNGTSIEGGVSRRLVKGDVVVIPNHVAHWWSNLETDIRYLIIRPDPESKLSLK